MKIIIRAYGIGLLAFTGWRTYDFMTLQLPVENGYILALFFLLATEFGLLLWHEASISHTTTYMQHRVAIGLTWLDLAGSTGAGIADMILRQTLTEMTVPPLMTAGLIYGLPLLVLANVAGMILYTGNDADTQRARQFRLLDFEAEEQAYKELNTHRRNLVAGKKRDIIAEITGKLDENTGNLPVKRPKVASNGREPTGVNYNSETEVATTVNPTPARKRS